MANPKKVNTLVSLKDEVKEKLKEDIIMLKLKPGDRIVETEVAKKLGISQVPVREALRGLEEEGLINTIKYRGAFVSDINPVEMYHMFSLRAKIETDAIEAILPKLTKRHFGELYDIVDKMKSGENDYAVQSRLDMEFHRTIIEWANVDVYLRIWGMLTNHIRRYITLLNPKVRILPEEVHQYHHALVEMLEERDAEKAKNAFREHIMKMVEK
ncbi:GntR family transcriptional regulator [Bacillus haikouensis]|uniref:GntR family transcriptional regulator n=1 Tax=Bacillus haikouensis TaxID=1510468 RepID=UPI0015576504|nr:GntR family transcriptional regulator [Bacillus haikouensis]NQD65842.1 GntR family transcriptional regulator [Bacillus haikouensis]